MEDALAQGTNVVSKKLLGSLNPCFNGRCTRTELTSTIRNMLFVLILVLMEDALAPFVVASLASCQQVLILVLMEDALAPCLVAEISATIVGLNPCFNGRCTRTCLT